MWDYVVEPLIYYVFPTLAGVGLLYFFYGIGLRIVKVGDKFAQE